jgi:pyrophosphate--fructose-6-phosphate 1-phosphotransferase
MERKKFKPTLPNILKRRVCFIKPVVKKNINFDIDNNLKEILKNTYFLPNVTFKFGLNLNVTKKKQIKVAVVFSGGPAPGGHNVICGLFDGLKSINKKNILVGYLGGLSGVLENKYKLISKKMLDNYKNTGGFDFIQSGRTKIETAEEFCLIKNNILISKIDALIIVGGDDSNTNAAMIAEYIKNENLNKCIIGIPKTIDGDLKNKYIETSFGFDTATKIYSNLVGNICRDVNSTQKHWHFVRVMGRSASHIALEVGLKTHPNIVLIGEEIMANKTTLFDVVESIVNVVVERSKHGKNFGVVLIPEGIIEFICEIRELIHNLNDVLFDSANIVSKFCSIEDKKRFVYNKISKKHLTLIKSLPIEILLQLISDRDPHGNVQVSLIETEKLLIEMVRKRLSELEKINKCKYKFSAIPHFFGYEGRCEIPSNFDANYAYALGYNAVILAVNGLTGYLSLIKNLVDHPKHWKCGGISLAMMMNIEKRNGKYKPVIRKSLVDLNGDPFKNLVKHRTEWSINDDYIFPGPIQYFGSPKLTNMTTETIKYERQYKKLNIT